jgi:hypothetical protein
MKDLIRQKLKEYIESRITITEISPDSPIIKNILIEQNINFYDENNNIVNIGEVRNELTSYFKSHYNHPSSKPDGFCGEYKNNSDSCNKKFIIDSNGITIHFVERIYRLSHPDYQIGGINYNPLILNPGKYEGIDFFFNNIKNLIEKINKTNEIGWVNSGDKKFYMFTKKDIDFSIIIQILKVKPKYEVKFISQIKGVPNWKSKDLVKTISVNVD